MTDRTDIVSTIMKLRALAESAGEAEAFAAMRKADRMMTAYSIEEAELAMAEASGGFEIDLVTVEHSGATKNGRNRSRSISALNDLRKYCEVKICYSHNYDIIHITGHRPDVELFRYLADLIKRSLDVEYERWKRTQQAVPRSAKASFQEGMARRIAERLREMTKERDTQRKQDIEEATKLLEPSEADKLRSDMATGNIKELTSTALVVASIAEQKQREVHAEYQRRHPRLSAGRGFGWTRGHSAYSAGQKAGNNVNFGRPVSGGASKALLR